MRILDATAGARMIYHQKRNPNVLFMDKRRGEWDCANGQHISIQPDIIAEWQHLPFRSSTFDMVVFDPPQIFATKDYNADMTIRYGWLPSGSWRTIIKNSAVEMFRVLKEDGTLILKWSNVRIKIKDILPLIPYKPLFGCNTGKSNNTVWLSFIKEQESAISKQLASNESDETTTGKCP